MAFGLELIPLIGFFFIMTNTVSAALWAADEDIARGDGRGRQTPERVVDNASRSSLGFDGK